VNHPCPLHVVCHGIDDAEVFRIPEATFLLLAVTPLSIAARITSTSVRGISLIQPRPSLHIREGHLVVDVYIADGDVL
jgi:hypothetical protein